VGSKKVEVRRPFYRHPVVRVVVILVLLVGVSYGLVGGLRIVLGTETPLMVVSSGSMIPTLNVGDIILVRSINPNNITVGTIMIFHDPQNYDLLIVHRVAEVNHYSGLNFFTKGDNNPLRDEWRVPASDVIGVLAYTVPYVGLVSLELNGGVGLTLIIALIAALIILEYRGSSKDKMREGGKR